MEDRRFYERLVQRYLDNTASKEELAVFFELLQEGKLDAYLERLSFEQYEGAKPRRRVLFFNLPESYRVLGYAAAASVFLALLTGLLFYTGHRQTISGKQESVAATASPQARPGTAKAVLTLSDGKSVVLGKNRQRLQDGGAAIISQNDALVYNPSEAPATPLYNTIVTPKGGEYKLTLPDGTAVWLNAGTSLRYPTAFIGGERRVELHGEAYFEVTKDASKPFVVQAADAEIKVVGTHFNVKAYDDEAAMTTTLAEGAVILQKENTAEKLVPGQAGTVEKGTKKISVALADLEQDLAWHNGVFYFQKTPLANIMRQLSRWYDLDIAYAGKVPDKRFVGRISRYTDLSDVLTVLRASDVKFSMKGKTLVVEE